MDLCIILQKIIIKLNKRNVYNHNHYYYIVYNHIRFNELFFDTVRPIIFLLYFSRCETSKSSQCNRILGQLSTGNLPQFIKIFYYIKTKTTLRFPFVLSVILSRTQHIMVIRTGFGTLFSYVIRSIFNNFFLMRILEYVCKIFVLYINRI